MIQVLKTKYHYTIILNIMIIEECKKQICELQNIIDSFVLPSPFDDDEYTEVLETASLLIDDLITNDPMIYILPKFHETVYMQICDLLEGQLAEIYDYDISDVIEKIVSENEDLREYFNYESVLFYWYVLLYKLSLMKK